MNIFSFARILTLTLFPFLLALSACQTIRAAPPSRPAAQEQIPAQNLSGTLSLGGLNRSYQMHVPARKPGQLLPLVVVLHGGSSTGRGMRQMTGMDARADQAGFVALYPNGYLESWADGRKTSRADVAGVDDVRFISSLVKQVANDTGIDLSRVYVTGMSNGGFMTARLACESSELFAAVAVVAATMPQNVTLACKPARGVPFLLIHGTADTFVPAAGGQITKGNIGLILSTDLTVDFWREINGCSKEDTLNTINRVADGTSVEVSRFSSCVTRADVVFYKVLNGGHTWPGGAQYLPEAVIGKTNRDIEANAVIWDFFSTFSR